MSDGSVFVRVAGRTVPVLDPALLRSLFASGDAARERATDRAREAATLIYKSPLPAAEAHALLPAGETTKPSRSLFGLALAPVGWTAALQRAAFTESFAQALLDRLTVTSDAFRTTPATLDVSRAWVQGTMSAYRGAWVARVYAGGVAAVASTSELLEEYIRPSEVMAHLEKAWKLAADVLADLGADGEARLALHVQTTSYPPGGQWSVSPKPEIDLIRPAAIDSPTADELASIERELEREAGYPSWEPEA